MRSARVDLASRIRWRHIRRAEVHILRYQPHEYGRNDRFTDSSHRAAPRFFGILKAYVQRESEMCLGMVWARVKSHLDCLRFTSATFVSVYFLNLFVVTALLSLHMRFIRVLKTLKTWVNGSRTLLLTNFFDILYQSNASNRAYRDI